MPPPKDWVITKDRLYPASKQKAKVARSISTTVFPPAFLLAHADPPEPHALVK